jgi:hypothetical protein
LYIIAFAKKGVNFQAKKFVFWQKRGTLYAPMIVKKGCILQEGTLMGPPFGY